MTNNHHSSDSAPASFQTPLVSVVLPVYNGGAYLAESIQSILTQTYTNIELIIIDDGSTDNSSEIVRTFLDPRIRFTSQSNQGLPATLNRAIRLSKGKYIARQDADDVSFPMRIQRQVDFFEQNPEYGVVGTWSKILGGVKDGGRGHRHPIDNERLKFNLLFDSYFVHSSVMLRKSVIDKVGFYATDKTRQPEDFELWSRIVRDGQFKVANIPEVLVIYREVAGSICRTGTKPFSESLKTLCAENIAWASGRTANDPAVTDMAALVHLCPRVLSSKPNFKEMKKMLHEAATKIGGRINIQLLRELKRRLLSMRYNYIKMRSANLARRVVRSFSIDGEKR